jgi:prepilin-type N-terminal cleavage/methylation domain-containing protein
MGIVERVNAVRRDDSGVTLVEIMVALSLLLVLSVSVAAGLLAVQKSALRSKERSAAANLATREIEIVRNWFHSADTAPAAVIAAGDTTNANPLPGQTGPLVVDNVPYTVSRQVGWLITGTGVSACDGGSIVSYPSISVHVEVSWPNMGGVPPVVSDTVLTPPKSVLNATSAYLAVKVIDRDGQPNDDRVVTANGPSGTSSDTTGSDGCATFVLSSPGTYTIAVTEGSSGYVSFNGATTQTATVTAGSLTVRSFTYDLGVSFTTTLKPPTGFALPATLPAVTFGNSGILPSGVTSFPSTAGPTTTVGPLWPFASGYSVWSGSCTDSDPALLGGRPPALSPTRGTTTTANAALQAVAVTTTKKGVPVSVPVYFYYSGSGSCPSGDGGTMSSPLFLGNSVAGVLNTSLPYGNWTLTTQISGQTVTDLVTLSPTAGDTSNLNGTN